jgi:hypothetical protein
MEENESKTKEVEKIKEKEGMRSLRAPHLGR